MWTAVGLGAEMDGDFLFGTLGTEVLDEVFFEIIGSCPEGVMDDVIMGIHDEFKSGMRDLALYKNPLGSDEQLRLTLKQGNYNQPCNIEK
jgi:hypothetical protein